MIVLLNDLWFPEIRDREEDIKEAHAKTFRWLLSDKNPEQESSIFADWLRRSDAGTDGNRIFWINGKPGSGKSTLMKYIHKSSQLKSLLAHWAGDAPLICPAIFLWDRGKSLMHKSREGMVRSLLHQILTWQKDLVPSVFANKWHSEYAIRKRMDWSNRTRKAPSWDWNELFEALQLLTDDSWQREQQITMRICVFVDGLDEYGTFEDSTLWPDEAIDRKRQGYREIIQDFEALAKSPAVKLCLSSRRLPEFKSAFDRPSHALQLEDLTREDISCYTRASLKQDTRFQALASKNAVAAQLLIKSIVDKAQGVFLWVVVVIRLLLSSLQDGDKLCELQDQLEKIPEALGGKQGLYALMLRNIKVQHRMQCLQLLELVRYSASPPTLLSIAFADGERDDCLYKDIKSIPLLSKPELQYITGRMEDRIHSRCAGLLEVVKVPISDREQLDVDLLENKFYSLKRVQFMHQTAKDFAEQPEIRHILLPESDMDFNPHTPLLASCILELKLTDPWRTLIADSSRDRSVDMMDIGERNWTLLSDAMLYAFREDFRESSLRMPT